MIHVYIHGTKAITASLHKRESTYWVDLTFNPGHREQEVTIFFDEYELAERFFDALQRVMPIEVDAA